MRELITCPICNERQREILFPATARGHETWDPRRNPYSGHYQINVCRGCELVFSSPVLDEEDIQTLYTEYRETNVADDEIHNVRRTMEGYYRLASPYIRDKERFLDIGCDIGLLLEIAKAEGFQRAYGIEPVAVAREQAIRRVPDAVISEKFYEQAEFDDGYFDLIALVHVVDHLIRPDLVLNRVLSHLKPGGICVAVVHDVQSPLARLTGERFPVFNYLHHFFFSKRTLRALFEARGFEVLLVAPTRNTYSVSFFIERAPFLPIGLRRTLARTTRSLGFGRLALSIAVGNIAIVARKPAV